MAKTHHVLTYTNTVLITIILALLVILPFSGLVPVEFVLSEVCDDSGECESRLDAIKIAVQLGRLDFVSIGATVLGIALGIGAIFGFLYIRERAEIIAKETAEEIVSDQWDIWSVEVLPKLVAKEMEKWKRIYSPDLQSKQAEGIAEFADDADGPSDDGGGA